MSNSSLTEGKKYDAEKLDWSLVDLDLLRPVVEVLQHGERKYGRANWQHVDKAEQRYFAALLRHLAAYQRDPRSHDEESGLPHIAHAVCNALFLLWFVRNSSGQDKTHSQPSADKSLEEALQDVSRRLKNERLARDRAPSALVPDAPVSTWGERFD